VSWRFLAASMALLVAGCAGGDGEGGKTSPDPPPATEALEEMLRDVELVRPGVVLRDFVRAAARRDERRMWERLSAPTRRRLGPKLGGFRRGAARGLERELAALGRRPELILSERITQTFAVAAVARQSGGVNEAYAAALRLEGGLWRVELGSAVRIRPLRPEPAERVPRRTQLAAEVTARETILEAGLWLDGRAFPTRGGGAIPSALTMFGEASALSPGTHSVVAFASTGTNAAAHAWTFRAGRLR
jgi:hypothetical protein